jgi:hypothetical protein
VRRKKARRKPCWEGQSGVRKTEAEQEKTERPTVESCQSSLDRSGDEEKPSTLRVPQVPQSIEEAESSDTALTSVDTASLIGAKGARSRPFTSRLALDYSCESFGSKERQLVVSENLCVVIVRG